MPNALDTTPEAIVAEGNELGKTPQEIATKVKQWRGDMLDHGAKEFGDKDPNHYAAGVDKLDTHVGEVLNGLRGDAVKQWAQTTFKGREAEVPGFIQAAENGAEMTGAGYDQEKQDFAKLNRDEAFQLPRRSKDWHVLNDTRGSEIGRMQFIPRGKENDVLLNYHSGDEGGMKQARVTVPEIHADDLETEAKASEERAKQARTRAAAHLADAERFMAGNTAFPSVEAYQLRADKAKAEEEAATRDLLRAQSLRSANGRDALMQERVLEKVRTSPLANEIGQRNLSEDFYRGMAQFFTSSRVAFNDVTGDKQERDQWRGHLDNLRQYFPGSTGPKNTEGVRGFVSDAAEGAGGMVPQMVAMAAGPAVGAGTASAIGAASLASMGGSAYGAGVNETLNRADQLEREAETLAQTDAQGAAQLRTQAAGLREDYRRIAAEKAAVEVGSEMILPEQNILRGASMGATALKRVGTVAGKSFAEGAIAEAGNQLVNRSEFGDAINPAQILRGGALEAAAGAPMIAASAFAGEPRKSENDNVSTSQTPPAAEPVPPGDAASNVDALPAAGAANQVTIGGRRVLLKPATVEEQQQMEAMGDYWNRAQQQIEQQVGQGDADTLVRRSEAEAADKRAESSRQAEPIRSPLSERVPTMAEIAESGGQPAGRFFAEQPFDPAAEEQRAAKEAEMRMLQAKAGRGPVIPNSPLGNYDILDFLNENNIRLPRNKEQRAQGEYDWTEQFSIPPYYRKFIASKTGGSIDAVAQMAHENGFTRDPSVDALMAAVQQGIETRKQYRFEFAKREREQRVAEKQAQDFDRTQDRLQRKDKQLVDFDAMLPDDVLTIDGERVTVKAVEHDDEGHLVNVTLQDGKRFGLLQLDPQGAGGVFVDAFTPRPRKPVNEGPESERLQFSHGRQRVQDSLAQQALQTIFPHEPAAAASDHPDRSGSDAPGARSAARALVGAGAEASLGWNRQQARQQRHAREVEFLSRHARPEGAKGERKGEGGEHIVHHVPGADYVTKTTKPGQYGQMLDQMGPEQGLRFNWRPAMPSEYLQRIGLQNAVFGDNMQIAAIEATPHGPAIVTTQPLLEGEQPTSTQVEAFLRANGFEPMDERLYDTQTIHAAKRPWLRARDGVMVTDAKTQNFVVHRGHILPIDLIVQLMPDAVINATRAARQFKTGVGAPTVNAKAVTDALKLIGERLPHLMNGRLKVFANAAEFFASNYARKQSLTDADLRNIETAEAFYDGQTGHTILFTDQIDVREGESPMRAAARVLIHERIGHEGVNYLLRTDVKFAERFVKMVNQIPAAELDAIANLNGYESLTGDRLQLALEWLARQTERIEGARNATDIEGGLKGVAKQLWQAVKEWLQRLFANFSRSAANAAEVNALITKAREAIENGTADPTNAEALTERIQFAAAQFSMRTPFHAKGKAFEVSPRALALRTILTGSPLPRALRDVVTRTQTEKQSLDATFARNAELMKVAIDQVVKRTGWPIADVYAKVNDVLNGNVGAQAVLMAVDEGLAEATRRARNLLDMMSDAIAGTLPAGDLRNTLIKNLGAWMKRGYAAFDPASGWNFKGVLEAARAGKQIAGRDAAVIMREAAHYLETQDPSLTGQRDARGLPKEGTLLHAEMKDLMDREVWMGTLLGARAVRKATGSLMRRKDIAPELRALMGEENNPLKRFAMSGDFQAQFLARHQGQVAMAKVGLAAGLFQANRGGDYNVQIPGDYTWSGLGGLWTTPELWAALQQSAGVDLLGAGAGGMLLQGIYWLSNLAKLNRVALNPKSWLPNIYGGLVAMVQSGDVLSFSFFRRLNEAIELMQAGKATTKDVENAATIALKDAQRAMLSRLQSQGVIGSNVLLKDIEASIPRHLLQMIEKTEWGDKAEGALRGALIGNAFARAAGGPLSVARAAGIAIGAAAGGTVGGANIQEIQQRIANFILSGPDNLVKITGWLRNYEVARRAGLTDENAAKQASERTLKTFPNYANMPEIARQASRLGLVGSFIAFQVEVLRNYGHNWAIAYRDLRSGNAVLQGDAVRRLIGLSSVSALAFGGIGGALSLILGSTPPDDERNKKWRKWFAAPWEKDAMLNFTKYDAKGVSYFNQAYIVPQTTMAELLQAIKNGKDPADAAQRLLGRLWEQYGIGSSVHVSPLLASLMNQNRAGRPITYRKGVPGAVERIDEAAKTIADPGVASLITEVVYALQQKEVNGKVYSLEQIARQLGGMREQTRTWEHLLESRYKAFGTDYQNIRSEAKKRIRESTSTPAAAMQWANDEIVKLQTQVKEFENDLPSMNVPKGKQSAARREAGIGTLSTVKLDRDGRTLKAD